MKSNKIAQNTALLVMDVENAIVNSLENPQPLLDSLSDAIETARNNNIPVIYIKVAFREGYPEVSVKNKSFTQLKNGAMNFEGEQATAIHPSIAPQSDDIIITKKRVSAFTGSDLEVVLRSLEINHLLLTGIATSGVTNDQDATDKIVDAFRQYFPADRIRERGPAPASEDFGSFGVEWEAPSVFWFVGGTDPDIYAKAKAENKINEIPTNHSPHFLPVIHPTLETGVETLTVAARAWLAS
jgi:isochorismate hydrolase